MPSKEQLLAEVEDLLRTMPSVDEFVERVRLDDNRAWLGRAAAVIERWDLVKSVPCNSAVDMLKIGNPYTVEPAFGSLRTLLHQARADLRMEVGQVSVVIQPGQVFDYFNEIRKVVEAARSDVFFVDAYLDADFVSRYLPHIAQGAAIRLLTGTSRLATLLPAVDLFAQQSQRAVQVRSSSNLHDRFVFVDRSQCYLSGASFKDGAKNAPAVLTEITDGFEAMWRTYDDIWVNAKRER